MTKKVWIGKYAYTFDENTQFYSFEIEANYEDGSFEGTVYEEEFSGFTKDLVHVKGFIEGELISFVKTYPYYYAIDDFGNTIIGKQEKDIK